MSFLNGMAGKSGRVLGLAAAVVLASAGLAGSAGAMPSAGKSAAPIECDMAGSSIGAYICVDLRAQSGYVTCGEQNGIRPVAGHIRIWGPGGMRAQSVDSVKPFVCGHGIGHGQTCAEFMMKLGPGRYESRGLACKDV